MNRHYACLFAIAMVAAGCGTKKSASVAETPGISGTVVSTTGAAIAGAQVTVNARTVLTDKDGAFSIASSQDADSYVVLRVNAAGYPEGIRRITMPSSGRFALQFTLRPVDQSQTFALPTGSDTADFNIVRGSAGAALSIPAAALVDTGGNVAVGNANINLTFWSPEDDVSTAPAVLRASGSDKDPRDANPVTLLSYGMVDINIEQDGNKLQVAPGAALALTLQTTDARRQALAQRGNDIPTGPTLWTLNPNTGVWDQDVGDSNFDMTTGQLQATLHHLSTKNSDEPYTLAGPSTGTQGCIQGRAYGACGQPLPNAVITINAANTQLGPGVPMNWVYTTNSSGTFKANVNPSGHNNYYASATWNGHWTDMTRAPLDPALQFISWSPGVPVYPRLIFVPLTCSDISGACQNQACSCFSNTSDPGGCMEAMEAADPADVNGYNACWANPLGNNWLGPCFDDQLTGSPVDTHYNTVWKSYKPTTLCANCWPILDMVFKDVAGDQSPGCTGQGGNGQGCCPAVLPAGAYNICTDLSSPYRKTLSQTCTLSTDTCCGPNGAVGLQCADNVCVPYTDPASQE